MDTDDLRDVINRDPDFNVAAINLAKQILNDEGFDFDAPDAAKQYDEHAQFIGDSIYEQLICPSFCGPFGDALLEAVQESVDWFDIGKEWFDRAVWRPNKEVTA